MSENILEINIRAKSQRPQPMEVPADHLQLQVGKKYLARNGKTYTCMTQQGGFFTCLAEDDGPWNFLPDGKWYGAQHIHDYERHLMREWWSDVHDSWLAGKSVQYRVKGGKTWTKLYDFGYLGQVPYNEKIITEYATAFFNNPNYEVRVMP